MLCSRKSRRMMPVDASGCHVFRLSRVEMRDGGFLDYTILPYMFSVLIEELKCWLPFLYIN